MSPLDTALKLQSPILPGSLAKFLRKDLPHLSKSEDTSESKPARAPKWKSELARFPDVKARSLENGRTVLASFPRTANLVSSVSRLSSSSLCLG